MNLKGKQPGSTRGQIRSYLMAQQPGKKITIEKIAGALGFDHAEIIHNMSAMIRNGEPFEVATKAKAWRYVPPGTKQGHTAADTERLINGARAAKARAEVRAEAAGVRPDAVSESLTRTHHGRGRLEADVLNQTSKGSLIFQTDDGVVWIARKIEE